ncbi:cobalamin-binding protein [Entomomonas sp. E2T0]|uniref:cobalamin-binding protein n=1 Tax=Entomomonas sp. E2T0 TaxID=2930213 RepID=UPI0022281CC2|nr:cobalamin-binding protein [Entomomonas sp. E2T0]UYZ84850.1 cobalamin-binding protein [Entomomonas sp. E2T0]
MHRLIKLITIIFIVSTCSISFADSQKLRVISLTPSLTDIVIELEGADLLVGVSDYDKQRLPILEKAQPVGNLEGYSLEKIISLQPDVILIWPTSIKPSQQQQLISLGYKIVETNPHTLDELALQLASLGKKIGREQQGKELSEKMQNELTQLRQRYHQANPLKVFYQLWDKPIYTIGKNQIIGDALKVCGAENIFDNVDLPAPQVNIESVLAKNPQVIIASQQSLLDAWLAWPQLSAVKNHKLFIFDNDRIARPSFAMLEATKQLCSLLNQDH